jgi:hypothetical protein
MQPPDPDFPSLPYVSEGYSNWTNKQKADRHTLEVREAAKMFDAMQAAGMSIFDAAENLPVPRMNRAGARQDDLRELYRDEPRSEVLPPAAE